MSLADIEPKEDQRIIDLVEKAGLDISDWGNFKGGIARAATNPRYCYEWCFVGEDIVVLNFWHDQLISEDGRIYRQFNMRELAEKDSKPIWKKRARRMDNVIRMAYESQLPVRIILGSGVRRKSDDVNAKSSKIEKRLLDDISWAVTIYDSSTGDCVIERGISPMEPTYQSDLLEQVEIELPEGELKQRLTKHRQREYKLRRRKIDDSLHKNNGRLLCEVPNCNFDFLKIYGKIGAGYAQVHHLIPLSLSPPEGRKAKLEDLAIVCANCHVMIHRNGECRPMENLIPSRKKK